MVRDGPGEGLERTAGPWDWMGGAQVLISWSGEGFNCTRPSYISFLHRLDILHQVAIWQKNFKRIVSAPGRAGGVRLRQRQALQGAQVRQGLALGSRGPCPCYSPRVSSRSVLAW